MWPVSLEVILETLGLKILVIEDEVAAARTLARARAGRAASAAVRKRF
jgi:hypothetical protein